MRVYHIDNKAILHFGLGLIGTAFSDLIKSNQDQKLSSRDIKFSWLDQKSNTEEFVKISDCIKELNVKDIHVLWTAGKAGFLANEEETNNEYHQFKLSIEQILSLFEKDYVLSFTLLSSSGGLFESQKNIGQSSIPNPQRPYGFLKLKQEELLEISKNSFKCINIIRPSSVFSVKQGSGRKGLINTLIENHKSGKITSIYGSPTTLRDYVLDLDIAELILKLIKLEGSGLNRYTIASGNPYSISNIVQTIEELSFRPVKLVYKLNKLNSADITYNKREIINGRMSQEMNALIRRSLQ